MEPGVPATRLHKIAKERRSVSADTAERLAREFALSAGKLRRSSARELTE